MDESKDNLELEQMLSRLADGDLPADQAEKLRRQIDASGELRRLMGQYEALDEHLAAIGGEDLNGLDYDAQRGRIMAQLERKALLGELRPRRRILRPVFAVMSAAAVVLIAASVWFMINARPPEPVEQMIVELVPVAPAPVGEVKVVLSPQPLDWDKLALATAEDAPAGNIPPGTVMVSVGMDGENAAYEAVDSFSLYEEYGIMQLIQGDTQ